MLRKGIVLGALSAFGMFGCSGGESTETSLLAYERGDVAECGAEECFVLEAEKDLSFIAVKAEKCFGSKPRIALHAYNDGHVGDKLDIDPVVDEGNSNACEKSGLQVPAGALKFEGLNAKKYAVCVSQEESGSLGAVDIYSKAGTSCELEPIQGECRECDGEPDECSNYPGKCSSPDDSATEIEFVPLETPDQTCTSQVCTLVKSGKDLSYIAVDAEACGHEPANVELYEVHYGRVGTKIEATPKWTSGNDESCSHCDIAVPEGMLKFENLSKQKYAVCISQDGFVSAGNIKMIAKAGTTCTANATCSECVACDAQECEGEKSD